MFVLTKEIIEEIENIQKNFLWNSSAPKIKHSAICNSFATDGLREVDINTKIVSLQCSDKTVGYMTIVVMNGNWFLSF